MKHGVDENMQEKDVVVAIIKRKDKILCGRKAPGKGTYPDTWHIPGGCVEAGEELTDALIREIKEETNLDISEFESIGTASDETLDKNGKEIIFHFHYFMIESFSGKETPGDDLVRLKWIPISELSNHDISKPSEKLFRRLGYIK